MPSTKKSLCSQFITLCFNGLIVLIMFLVYYAVKFYIRWYIWYFDKLNKSLQKPNMFKLNLIKFYHRFGQLI